PNKKRSCHAWERPRPGRAQAGSRQKREGCREGLRIYASWGYPPNVQRLGQQLRWQGVVPPARFRRSAVGALDHDRRAAGPVARVHAQYDFFGTLTAAAHMRPAHRTRLTVDPLATATGRTRRAHATCSCVSITTTTRRSGAPRSHRATIGSSPLALRCRFRTWSANTSPQNAASFGDRPGCSASNSRIRSCAATSSTGAVYQPVSRSLPAIALFLLIHLRHTPRAIARQAQTPVTR